MEKWDKKIVYYAFILLKFNWISSEEKKRGRGRGRQKRKRERETEEEEGEGDRRKKDKKNPLELILGER